jgi:hypothetical protein
MHKLVTAQRPQIHVEISVDWRPHCNAERHPRIRHMLVKDLSFSPVLETFGSSGHYPKGMGRSASSWPFTLISWPSPSRGLGGSRHSCIHEVSSQQTLEAVKVYRGYGRSGSVGQGFSKSVINDTDDCQVDVARLLSG